MCVRLCVEVYAQVYKHILKHFKNSYVDKVKYWTFHGVQLVRQKTNKESINSYIEMYDTVHHWTDHHHTIINLFYSITKAEFELFEKSTKYNLFYNDV